MEAVKENEPPKHQQELHGDDINAHPPAAKKQKLDTPTNVLRKPFKSPMHHHPTSPNTPIRPRDKHQPSSLSTPFHPPHSSTFPSTSTPTSNTTTTPARANRLLENRIASLRTDIDDLTQASRLLQSTRDAELARLMATWRAAARAACEDLFAGVQDKVNRMGGVGAWREREKERVERRLAWDAEDRAGAAAGEEESEDEEEDGDGAVDLEVRARREDRRQARREMREALEGEVSEYDRAVEEEKKREVAVEGGRDDDVSFFFSG